ncbi:MAG: tetratricopeptide repeat protein [Candidatus Tectomicrobia bacterium]|nr:tetratricopeptide repeat protein [Candidatus Tectomicrobia bacterium]
MSNSYPRKYWWLVLIVIPLVVGLIGVVPKFHSSSEDGSRITIESSNVHGNVQIIGTQVVLNQLKKSSIHSGDVRELEAQLRRATNLVKGGFYKDAIPSFEEIVQKASVPAVYANLGTLYLLDKQYEKARRAFKEGIAVDPTYQPLHLRLGQLYEKEGKIQEAKNQLKKAPKEAEAKAVLARLENKVAAGLLEQEPNNDIFSPNDLVLAKNIQGSIRTKKDIDFFRFTTFEPPRDIFSLEVKNRSTNLQPRVRLWGSDKRHLWSSSQYSHQVTPGQDISYKFSAQPNTIYYLSVGSLGAEGDYQLVLSPEAAFDQYEPNDDILTTAAVKLNSPIEANLILDDQVFFACNLSPLIFKALHIRGISRSSWISYRSQEEPH